MQLGLIGLGVMGASRGERDSRVAMLLQEERTGIRITVDAERLQDSLKGHDVWTG